jgi:hypothetical protein
MITGKIYCISIELYKLSMFLFGSVSIISAVSYYPHDNIMCLVQMALVVVIMLRCLSAPSVVCAYVYALRFFPS